MKSESEEVHQNAFNMYQTEVLRTANMALTKEMKQATFAMGLAGEAAKWWTS